MKTFRGLKGERLLTILSFVFPIILVVVAAYSINFITKTFKTVLVEDLTQTPLITRFDFDGVEAILAGKKAR